MTMASTRTLNLNGESAAIVEAALGSSDFEAPEQVVRLALQTWKAAGDRLHDLRAAIDEGAASGPGVAAEDVFSELETRYRAMLSRPASDRFE
jgi:Arc/MetJ-type ribon-helix-helix transcriptional regulator